MSQAISDVLFLEATVPEFTASAEEVVNGLEQLAAALPQQLWAWEPHGDGYALYSGRGPATHGLNMLSVPKHGFDSRGDRLRNYTALLLNGYPVLKAERDELLATIARLHQDIDALQQENQALRTGYSPV